MGCTGNEDTRNNCLSLYLINSIARVLILCSNLFIRMYRYVIRKRTVEEGYLNLLSLLYIV